MPSRSRRWASRNSARSAASAPIAVAAGSWISIERAAGGGQLAAGWRCRQSRRSSVAVVRRRRAVRRPGPPCTARRSACLTARVGQASRSSPRPRRVRRIGQTAVGDRLEAGGLLGADGGLDERLAGRVGGERRTRQRPRSVANIESSPAVSADRPEPTSPRLRRRAETSRAASVVGPVATMARAEDHRPGVPIEGSGTRMTQPEPAPARRAGRAGRTGRRPRDRIDLRQAVARYVPIVGLAAGVRPGRPPLRCDRRDRQLGRDGPGRDGLRGPRRHAARDRPRHRVRGADRLRRLRDVAPPEGHGQLVGRDHVGVGRRSPSPPRDPAAYVPLSAALALHGRDHPGRGRRRRGSASSRSSWRRRSSPASSSGWRSRSRSARSRPCSGSRRSAARSSRSSSQIAESLDELEHLTRRCSGIGSLVGILVLRRIAPRIPGALVALIVGIALSTAARPARRRASPSSARSPPASRCRASRRSRFGDIVFLLDRRVRDRLPRARRIDRRRALVRASATATTSTRTRSSSPSAPRTPRPACSVGSRSMPASASRRPARRPATGPSSRRSSRPA